MPGLDDDVRALYQGPLAEFTPSRNALAKRLRKSGDPGAGSVQALRKPTPAAWGVNQLFAQEVRGMAALVGAGERARALARRIARGGDPAPLRAALETITAETQRLTVRGLELLDAGGASTATAVAERLRTNLEALALDPAAASIAARRWLDEDLAPPGFEVLAELQIAAAGGSPAKPALHIVPKSAPAAEKPDPRIRARQERERRERLDARLDRLRAAVEASEKEATERQREADRLTQAADIAERRAVEARAAAQDAKERAEGAATAARQARQELADAGD